MKLPDREKGVWKVRGLAFLFTFSFMLVLILVVGYVVGLGLPSCSGPFPPQYAGCLDCMCNDDGPWSLVFAVVGTGILSLFMVASMEREEGRKSVKQSLSEKR